MVRLVRALEAREREVRVGKKVVRWIIYRISRGGGYGE